MSEHDRRENPRVTQTEAVQAEYERIIREGTEAEASFCRKLLKRLKQPITIEGER